ncbi:MAG TPA: F0F1 ATP synthase subunit epsilon [Bryobacteraceae bacterium]|nr:F0F1 ATP synthase subunit epsilon [Bryobacteraceae bacterium]
MRLTVWLPSQVLLDEEVDRIKAEAVDGWFGILPRHIDFVSALVPGVMTFQPSGKAEEYLAVDHGILVKCGAQVSLSTRNAVRGADLEKLRTQVEEEFRAREEREKAARAYEAKLEADLVRHLMEAERHA